MEKVNKILKAAHAIIYQSTNINQIGVDFRVMGKLHVTEEANTILDETIEILKDRLNLLSDKLNAWDAVTDADEQFINPILTELNKPNQKPNIET